MEDIMDENMGSVATTIFFLGVFGLQLLISLGLNGLIFLVLLLLRKSRYPPFLISLACSLAAILFSTSVLAFFVSQLTKMGLTQTVFSGISFPFCITLLIVGISWLFRQSVPMDKTISFDLGLSILVLAANSVIYLLIAAGFSDDNGPW